jgi:hypothetical protein
MTDMILQDSLLLKISKRERIQITSGFQEYLSLFLLVTYLIGSVCCLTFLFMNLGFSWIPLTLIFAFSLLFMPLFTWVCCLADIAVKGDILLISRLFKPCTVTSLNSISEIKTYRFLKFTFTRLTYYIDGKKGNILVFKRVSNAATAPEAIIRTVLQGA